MSGFTLSKLPHLPKIHCSWKWMREKVETGYKSISAKASFSLTRIPGISPMEERNGDC